jgi:uncharacterized protein YqgV (UPF0045/DUF77 family)
MSSDSLHDPGSDPGEHPSHRETVSTSAGVPAYASAAVTACQFSVYPLRQTDIDTPVQAAIAAVSDADVTVRVGNLSTLFCGEEGEVFRALRAAFQAVQSHGPAVMTATLTAGMPTDELVHEIQRAVVGSDDVTSDVTKAGAAGRRS